MGVEDIRGKLQNCKIGNFEGSSIWLKQALDREYQLQKYFLSFYLLSTFDWLGFSQRIWWNINWNKAYLATFGNFFSIPLSYSMGLSSVRSLYFLDQILHRLECRNNSSIQSIRNPSRKLNRCIKITAKQMHVCDDSELSLWLNRAVHFVVHGWGAKKSLLTTKRL